MINNDVVVVDAVAHAYNWTEENSASDWSAAFSAAGYGLHCLVSPEDEHRLSEQEFIADWHPDTLEKVFFEESDVDVIAYHSTPLHDYYKDGLVALDKGVRMRERHPNRVVLYGQINPLEGSKAIDLMEDYVNEMGITALKLYPARYHRGRTIPERLDDPKTGIPLVERALDLGIRSIAVHKAIPFGPTRSSHYQTDDVDEVAAMFPEMNFEIVHGGFAFTEEAAFLLGRFPNVWVNLEVTNSLIINNPRRFAEVIGTFLYWGGADRLMFASGCSFVHPQPIIDALLKFEMPEDLMKGYGYPEFTQEIKHKILGENWCRLHGINVPELKENLRTDTVGQQRAAQSGHAKPWSAIRGGCASD